jgi:uncharacterized protein
MKNLSALLLVMALLLVDSPEIGADSISDAEADIREGRYAKARATITPAAQAGDARAQYLLASLYVNGNGVPKDMKEAATWLERSAAQGYGRAGADLGMSYLVGRYHPKDTKLGAELLFKAASQGEPSAMYNLGVMYRDGLGVPPDPAKAAKYFSDAAEKGHSLAQYGLGRVAYQRGDYPTAARWYEKAGEQEDMEALYNLGYMYHEGQGVERDYKKANALFLRSAKLARYDKERRGYKSFDMLGRAYQYGEGVQQDLVEAYKWYTLAASIGHASANAHAQAIEKFLSPQQIVEAKQRASRFAKGQ